MKALRFLVQIYRLRSQRKRYTSCKKPSHKRQLYKEIEATRFVLRGMLADWGIA